MPRARSKAEKDAGGRQNPAAGAVRITPSLLRSWALPEPEEDADKEARGRVLVIGGSPEMPGAAILAATGALRAGAGKRQVATCKSVAPHVAAALPEGRVFRMAETKDGAMSPGAAAELASRANEAQSVLIGPGMVDAGAIALLMERFLPLLRAPALVMDAAALPTGPVAKSPGWPGGGKTVLTPHAGEMATMLGMERSEVMSKPLATAVEAARKLDAVVALKGATTYVAAPDGSVYVNRTGNVGLATSGSGDTLAGIVAGLAARGTDPLQAAVWGVYLHGRAGEKLARRMGRLGFLARELLAEIPGLMSSLGGPESRRSTR